MTTESAAAEPLRDRKVMAEPALVGECVAAMKAAAAVPVTVKCRIGDARKYMAIHRGSPELRTSCWRWPTSPGSAGSRLAAFQAEDVHHRLSAGIIGQAVPMTVKDNVVAVSKDTLDLAASIRMIRHDPGDELLQAFHAVFDQRIVLTIGGNSVKPEGLFDLAFEQALFVEGDGDG